MDVLDTSYFTCDWTKETIEDVNSLKGPILIVGASGFIGARLFHSLLNIRTDVFAISQNILSSWRMALLPKRIIKENLFNVDITNEQALRLILKKINPKTVFNLSAYGAYERQSDAIRIHTVNYLGTLNLLNLLTEMGIYAFVQTGSSSEYGLNCQGPLENAELRPNSHYAVSKASASYLVYYYGHFLGLPVTNLRLYSIYGPFEERDRLIPRLVAFGLKKTYPPLAGPEISRDFVYVDDCTAAIVRAANTACQNKPGVSINICTSTKTTLREIAQLSKEIFQIEQDPDFKSMPNRKWDLSNWYGKSDLAKSILNWETTTTLKNGLLKTKKWELDNFQKINQGFVPKKMKKISAIIACYRDHQAIPIMHERLKKTFEESNYHYEIIFVNDCSPTADEEVIKEISVIDSNVIGISHSRNFGSQSAFISGMGIATGDAVVLLDGDLQDPPELILEFIKKWEDGFDVVYGIREKRVAKMYMQIFYKIFYIFFKMLADINIPRDAGDFSLIDEKVVRHLLQLNEKDIFLRGLRAWVGFKQTGVPYVRPERMFGVSTNNFLKNIWWAKKAIFSFSLKPLEYIQRLSVLIFIASIGLATFYLINFFINPPEDGKGTTTIIILTLLMSGLQIFCLSIVGDYIGKILEEVKSRPKFIRSKIIKIGQMIDASEIK